MVSTPLYIIVYYKPAVYKHAIDGALNDYHGHAILGAGLLVTNWRSDCPHEHTHFCRKNMIDR